MSPSVAVLATWAVLAVWMLALGGFAGVLALARPGSGVVDALRVALWSGVTILVLALLALNLVLPLRSPVAAWSMVGLTVGTTCLAGVLFVARGGHTVFRAAAGPAWAWWLAVPFAGLSATLGVVAHATFGTVTNFDSGLYHLNAIAFAADYATVPGLANLHDRYGTNVSVFDVAAFLQNLPWGTDAFRLMVGFFLSLVVLDVLLRLLSRRAAPGTFVLLLATMLMVPFLLADTGYWITSPTADTTSMLVSVVSGAFLVDALWRRDGVDGSLAVMTAAVAASMRAQLWVLAVMTVVVLLAAAWHARRATPTPRPRPAAIVWVGGALAAGLLLVQLIRDAVLSGWLLYPAGNLPVPVEWRSADPLVARQWIQSWARTPGADPSTTLGNWDWLGPWAGRALDDWAIRGAIGLLALAVVVALAGRGRERSPGAAAAAQRTTARRTALLGVLPAAVTVLVWFLAAPDPRFAWGAIASVGLIPASVALAAAPRQAVVLPVVSGFMTLAVLPAALSGLAGRSTSVAADWQQRTYRLGPLTVVAAVNPVPVPAVEDLVLDSGVVVQRPVDGDQCWSVFPLCRPTTDTTLRMRGATVADGFLSGS